MTGHHFALPLHSKNKENRNVEIPEKNQLMGGQSRLRWVSSSRPLTLTALSLVLVACGKNDSSFTYDVNTTRRNNTTTTTTTITTTTGDGSDNTDSSDGNDNSDGSGSSSDKKEPSLVLSKGSQSEASTTVTSEDRPKINVNNLDAGDEVTVRLTKDSDPSNTDSHVMTKTVNSDGTASFTPLRRLVNGEWQVTVVYEGEVFVRTKLVVDSKAPSDPFISIDREGENSLVGDAHEIINKGLKMTISNFNVSESGTQIEYNIERNGEELFDESEFINVDAKGVARTGALRLNTLSVGEYVIKGTVFDDDGNIEDFSSTFRVVEAYDLQVELHSESNTGDKQDAITQDNTPNITLKNGLANGVVMVTVSQQPSGAKAPTFADITLDKNGKGSLSIANENQLADGEWVFRFNDGSKTVDYTIIVDKTAPDAPTLTQVDDSTLAAVEVDVSDLLDKGVKVSGVAVGDTVHYMLRTKTGEVLRNVAEGSVKVDKDNATGFVITKLALNSGETIEFNTEYTIEVTVQDIAGNISDARVAEFTTKEDAANSEAKADAFQDKEIVSNSDLRTEVVEEKEIQRSVVLKAESDSGVSMTDGITNQIVPKFLATGTPGEKVTITFQGSYRILLIDLEIGEDGTLEFSLKDGTIPERYLANGWWNITADFEGAKDDVSTRILVDTYSFNNAPKYADSGRDFSQYPSDAPRQDYILESISGLLTNGIDFNEMHSGKRAYFSIGEKLSYTITDVSSDKKGTVIAKETLTVTKENIGSFGKGLVPNLVDGAMFESGVKYSFYFKNEDLAGNVSDGYYFFKTKTVSGIQLKDSDDNGESADGSITNVENPTFIVTGTPGTEVQLQSYWSDLPPYTKPVSFLSKKVTIGEDGTVEVTLTDGDKLPHNGMWEVKVAFPYNHAFLDNVQHITLDTVKSDVYIKTFHTLDELVNDGVVLNGVTVDDTVAYSIKKEGQKSVISGGTVKVTADNIDGFSIGTFKLTGEEMISPGTMYTLDITVTDIAGNVSASALAFSTIGLTGITLAPNDDTGTSSSDGIINKNSPTFIIEGEAKTVFDLILFNQTLGKTIEIPSVIGDDGTVTVMLTDRALDDGVWTVGGELVSTEITVDTTAPAPIVAQSDGNVLHSAVVDRDDVLNNGFRVFDLMAGETLSYTLTTAGANPITVSQGTVEVTSENVGDFTTGKLEGTSAANIDADTAYVLAVDVSDTAGNTSVNYMINFSTSVENVESIELKSDDDTGIKGDGITNKLTPTVVVTGVAGDTVDVHVTGVDSTTGETLKRSFVISSVIDADGMAEITVPNENALTNGQWTFSAPGAKAKITVDKDHLGDINVKFSTDRDILSDDGLILTIDKAMAGDMITYSVTTTGDSPTTLIEKDITIAEGVNGKHSLSTGTLDFDNNQMFDFGGMYLINIDRVDDSGNTWSKTVALNLNKISFRVEADDGLKNQDSLTDEKGITLIVSGKPGTKVDGYTIVSLNGESVRYGDPKTVTIGESGSIEQTPYFRIFYVDQTITYMVDGENYEYNFSIINPTPNEGLAKRVSVRVNDNELGDDVLASDFNEKGIRIDSQSSLTAHENPLHGIAYGAKLGYVLTSEDKDSGEETILAQDSFFVNKANSFLKDKLHGVWTQYHYAQTGNLAVPIAMLNFIGDAMLDIGSEYKLTIINAPPALDDKDNGYEKSFTFTTSPIESIGLKSEDDSGWNNTDRITQSDRPTVVVKGIVGTVFSLDIEPPADTELETITVADQVIGDNGEAEVILPRGTSLNEGEWTISTRGFDASLVIDRTANTLEGFVDIQGNSLSGMSLTRSILEDGVIISMIYEGDRATYTITTTDSNGDTVTVFQGAFSGEKNGDVDVGQRLLSIYDNEILNPSSAYMITFDVADIAGNTSSVVYNFSISEVIGVTLITKDDTGFSNADGISKSNQPTLIITGDAGTRFMLTFSESTTENTHTINDLTIGDDGTAEVALTGEATLAMLGDGKWDVRVIKSENDSDLGSFSFSVDTTLDSEKSVSVFLSVNKDDAEEGMDLLRGTIYDINKGITVQSEEDVLVTFSINDGTQDGTQESFLALRTGTKGIASSGSLNLPLTHGTPYSLSYTVTDVAGNSYTKESLVSVLQIDKVSISSDYDSGSDDSDGVTNNKAPSFTIEGDAGAMFDLHILNQRRPLEKLTIKDLTIGEDGRVEVGFNDGEKGLFYQGWDGEGLAHYTGTWDIVVTTRDETPGFDRTVPFIDKTYKGTVLAASTFVYDNKVNESITKITLNNDNTHGLKGTEDQINQGITVTSESEGSVSIKITGEDNKEYYSKIHELSKGSSVSAQEGTYKIEAFDTKLTVGSYAVDYTITDKAGNKKAFKATIIVNEPVDVETPEPSALHLGEYDTVENHKTTDEYIDESSLVIGVSPTSPLDDWLG